MSKRTLLMASVFIVGVGTIVMLTPASADQPPVGTKIKIDLAKLPQPGDSPSKANVSKLVPRPAGAMPQVPPGFQVNIFAEHLRNARNMLVASNGDVLLAEQGAGEIAMLRDADGNGVAEGVVTFASGFNIPYGMAIANGALYVGDSKGVWRIPYTPGDATAREKQTLVTPEGAVGGTGGHSTRNVNVSADGKKLYVSIGSSSNIGEEATPRATIQEFALDATGTKASGQRTYASGLRNAVGTAFYPGTNDLYAVINERDTLGDELVPDYMTRVADNGFYGWPYSYLGQHPQPGYADKRPDLVAKAIVPDVLIRSHSAPLGLAFYTATQFPKEYQGGAFVALHGSWNAANPRGYAVAFVPFENKKPAGDYVVFASGFTLNQTTASNEVWGRPAGVAVTKDGSLLIADDGSNTVWRVSVKK